MKSTEVNKRTGVIQLFQTLLNFDVNNNETYNKYIKSDVSITFKIASHQILQYMQNHHKSHTK